MKYFVFVLGLLGAATAYAQRGGPPLATAPRRLLPAGGQRQFLFQPYAFPGLRPEHAAACAGCGVGQRGDANLRIHLRARRPQLPLQPGLGMRPDGHPTHEVNGRYDGQIGYLLRRRTP